ncbi:HK97 family phage prohead protease, partial [Schlesneria paludicola]|uniref:HK97 family phage prohead protease n=1 Tax=Schlesneria paludicola TaxID=360056 RepID=UPI00029AB9B4
MAPTMPQQIERRRFNLPVEIRSEGDKTPGKISGYSARYFDPSDPNTQYKLWEDCFERIQPGAFDSAISRGDDVRCLFNHNPDLILGRTTSGTCTIRVDAKGLWFEADLPNSPAGLTVAEAINRKDVTGCSFSFDVIAATWQEDVVDGESIWYRIITDVRLYDVGPVTFPAYGATDCDMASARSSLDRFRSSRPIPHSVRSRR